MIELTREQRAALERSASAAARLLRALGNDRRLMILCELGSGELPVAALQARVGLSQSALSQHLALLRDDGILASRRNGQAVFYRIVDRNAVKLVATLADVFCPAEAACSKN